MCLKLPRPPSLNDDCVHLVLEILADEYLPIIHARTGRAINIGFYIALRINKQWRRVLLRSNLIERNITALPAAFQDLLRLTQNHPIHFKLTQWVPLMAEVAPDFRGNSPSELPDLWDILIASGASSRLATLTLEQSWNMRQLAGYTSETWSYPRGLFTTQWPMLKRVSFRDVPPSSAHLNSGTNKLVMRGLRAPKLERLQIHHSTLWRSYDCHKQVTIRYLILLAKHYAQDRVASEGQTPSPLQDLRITLAETNCVMELPYVLSDPYALESLRTCELGEMRDDVAIAFFKSFEFPDVQRWRLKVTMKRDTQETDPPDVFQSFVDAFTCMHASCIEFRVRARLESERSEFNLLVEGWRYAPDVGDRAPSFKLSLRFPHYLYGLPHALAILINKMSDRDRREVPNVLFIEKSIAGASLHKEEWAALASARARFVVPYHPVHSLIRLQKFDMVPIVRRHLKDTRGKEYTLDELDFEYYTNRESDELEDMSILH